jgi:hypothetical protein
MSSDRDHNRDIEAYTISIEVYSLGKCLVPQNNAVSRDDGNAIYMSRFNSLNLHFFVMAIEAAIKHCSNVK